MEKLSYKTVWDTLSVVDLTGKTEVKQGFTYLAWASGVFEMNKYYPQHQITWGLPKVFEDGTVEIYCKVTIDNLYKDMWYSVTNYANKPIPNPSSFDMNSAKMRALMKTYAMFGLGIQLFINGEAKPQEVEKPDPEVEKIAKAKDKKKAVELALKNGGINENTNEIRLGEAIEKVQS